MQQRKPTAGRPSGTDGSDFSYRMVVDSRYTKVTKEKARLRPLIFVQAAIYVIGLSCAFLTTTKKDEKNTLAIAAAVAGLVCSLIGELGCRRSRVNLLRLYTAASTIVMVLSVFCAVRSRLTMEERNSSGTTAKLELAGFICAQLGAVVQILAIIVTGSLVNNMSPPTKAA
ncbi:putative protein jagunal [Arabidopsis thaliana]|uniref:Jagunal-like protein n=4 Tax=Arabidopsis TaxID=3701 RepID=Q9FHN3_ARATH|nr:jagunal-like protein [Arabidopsis thaliana]KAG7605702.1 Protein jagunal [Arabidopsis thaliana x Arabidopsis arenosa]KAG7612625.1 Protein jagunal [Arabidopsis suecica]AAM63179.1 unknown [Arabidopsis thaliana]AAO64088.1 unknown protein [Arabidopsis thaliana]AED96092.1 jagunal-like protein [Arabidopsis thaliana]|eukprot:NP_568761.1 jagunal-like protein [Arabidopsis thaliana]